MRMIEQKSFLDAFFRAYVNCALWSSVGPEEEPYACEYLDYMFDADDIAQRTRDDMYSDCQDFVTSNADDLEEFCERIGRQYPWTPAEQAGHDFWLSRNGHGAGFWDRGVGDVGKRLSDAARVYGSFDLYPGDDGKLYA